MFPLCTHINCSSNINVYIFLETFAMPFLFSLEILPRESLSLQCLQIFSTVWKHLNLPLYNHFLTSRSIFQLPIFHFLHPQQQSSPGAEIKDIGCLRQDAVSVKGGKTRSELSSPATAGFREMATRMGGHQRHLDTVHHWYHSNQLVPYIKYIHY